jgi:hypothetical protein
MAKITVKIVDDDDETIVIKQTSDSVDDNTALGALVNSIIARLEVTFKPELDDFKQEQDEYLARVKAAAESPVGRLLATIGESMTTHIEHAAEHAAVELSAAMAHAEAKANPDPEYAGPLDGTDNPVFIVVEDVPNLRKRVVDENVKNFGAEVPDEAPVIVFDEVAEEDPGLSL